MAQPVRLKLVLQERHWQTHNTFCREYDKAASRVDRRLVGTAPSRAQFNRWITGALTKLPHPHHCQVLETMFLGWTAQQLFEPGPIDCTRTSITPAGGPATHCHSPQSDPAAVALLGLSRVRAELDEALASASVSPGQLEAIEEATAEHARLYPVTPPTVMLSRLATECVEVQTLSRRRQPASVQSRLSGAAALLATMCADALMRLGDAGEARLWYRTAIHAADDSAERRIRILVRAQAAMLPYYFGSLQQVVSTADAALGFSGSPTPSSALAAAAKARALARIGTAGAARDAIMRARSLFDEVGEPDSDVAFRFPAKRLLFYLSGAMSWLGDTAAAYRIQDEALQLYGASSASPIDPTLIQLDRAMCLVHDRRAEEAAVTARAAIAGLARQQRTEIVLTRADDVVAAITPAARRGEVAALTEYARACREQASTLARGTAVLDP